MHVPRTPSSTALLLGLAPVLLAAVIPIGCSELGGQPSTPVEEAVAGRKESMKKFMQEKKAESQQRGKAARGRGPGG